MRRPYSVRVAGLAAALGLLACLAAPDFALACEDAGRACCDFCRMLLEDETHGGEIETRDGERLRFDASECMAGWVLNHPGEAERLRSVDYERPGTWIDAEAAHYLRSERLASPMGLGLSAFTSAERAERARETYGGEVLRWDRVTELVRERWYPGGAGLASPRAAPAPTPLPEASAAPPP